MKHRIGCIGLALLGLAACQRQEPAAAPLAVPPPAEPVAATRPMTVPAEPPKAAPKPATAEERAQGIQECWGHFNAKDFAKLSDCYAENATSEQVDLGTPPLSGRQTIIERNTKVFASAFPDLTGESELTLVSGDEILSVVLLKGTHQGPLPGPQGEVAATNKKIGYLALQHVVTSPDGRHIQKERFVYDGATFMSQLGLAPAGRKALEQGWAEKPSLTSTGSDGEKANVAAVAAYTAAFNKHDAPALAATLTEDVVFSDLSSPADRVGKKEATKSAEELFKGFPDVRLEQTSAWAAGDYVVTAGRFSGTHTGDMPGMKLKKTGKAVSVEYYLLSRLAGGRVKNLWFFSNGLAFAGQLGLLPPPKASKPGTAGKEPKPAAAGAPAAPSAPASPHAPPGAKAPGAPPLAVPPKAPPAPASAPPPASPVVPKEAKPVAPAPAPPPAAAPKAPPAPAAPPVPGGAR